MQPVARPWLSPFTWNFEVQQNAMLCQAKNALHKPTSDGYDATRDLWGSPHRQPTTLGEVTDLCRRCHRMAPFCFFNGNTFVAIARAVVATLALAPEQAFLVRSLAGHIVAGVASEEEVKAFRAFSDEYVDRTALP